MVPSVKCPPRPRGRSGAGVGFPFDELELGHPWSARAQTLSPITLSSRAASPLGRSRASFPSSRPGKSRLSSASSYHTLNARNSRPLSSSTRPHLALFFLSDRFQDLVDAVPHDHLGRRPGCRLGRGRRYEAANDIRDHDPGIHKEYVTLRL